MYNSYNQFYKVISHIHCLSLLATLSPVIVLEITIKYIHKYLFL